jgi:glucuronate isomerase
MALKALTTAIEKQLLEVPLLDVHAHIDPKQLSAQGLHHILLYHMCISDLYSAGMPDGSRLSWYADEKEVSRRIKEALPYLKYVKNTSMYWCVKVILRDLYGWEKEITEANWKEIDEIIREKSRDKEWPEEILKKSKVIRTSTEFRLMDRGQANDILEYSLEWAFFSRSQEGQNDISLFELEKAWNDKEAGEPMPVNIDRGKYPLEKVIRSLDDVKEAIRHYVSLIPFGKVMSTTQHISTDINYREVDDHEMEEALKNRSSAGIAERDIYASYVLHAFLKELQKHGNEIVYQFSFGAEPLHFETCSILQQKSISQLAAIITKYPELKFQCLLSSAHTNQALCTLSRELPNFSLAGYWWHNFFPEIIERVIAERLDMLPSNKQVGFFSDAYHLDWIYAKACLVRKVFAKVLAEKIDMGQYTREQAVDIFKTICHDTPKELLKI